MFYWFEVAAGCRDLSRQVATCRARQFDNLRNMPLNRCGCNQQSFTGRRFLTKANKVTFGAIALNTSLGSGVTGALINDQRFLNRQSVLVGGRRDLSRLVATCRAVERGAWHMLSVSDACISSAVIHTAAPLRAMPMPEIYRGSVKPSGSLHRSKRSIWEHGHTLQPACYRNLCGTLKIIER